MTDTLLRGHLLDAATGDPLPGLRVEAWDQNDTTQAPDYLGGDVSALDGSFRIAFDSAGVNNAAGGRSPDVYVDVFSGDQLVASTASAPFDELGPGSHDLAVPVRFDTLTVPPAPTAKPVVERVRMDGKVEVTGAATALTASPAGLVVTVRPAGEDRTIAEATVDAAGVFVFDYPHPGEIADPNAPIGTVDVWLGRPGEPLALVPDGTVDLLIGTTVDLTAGPVERPAPGGEALFSAVRAAAPGVYSQALDDAYGAMTLSALREAGGVAPAHQAEDGADRLDTLALLDALSPNAALNGALIDAGLGSLDALVAASPAQIAQATTSLPAQMTEDEASALRAAASAYRTTADAALIEAALSLASGQTGTEVDQAVLDVQDAIATILPAPAADDDVCSLATGPVAYLSALMSAADDGDDATTLGESLHTQVESVETRCSGALEELVSLRPVAESLLSVVGPPDGDAEYVDAAYTALLAELGTSPAELTSSADLPVEVRRRLAERLGLPDETVLSQLVPAAITATELEATYGLRRLDGGSPSASVEASELFALRHARIQRRWRMQDWGHPRDRNAVPTSPQEAYAEISGAASTVPISERARPVIDPDLIPLSAIPATLADGSTPNPAHGLYTSRRGAIDGFAADLSSALAGAGAADALVETVSGVALGAVTPELTAAWGQLVTDYAAGRDVADDLALAYLDVQGMSRLATAWVTLSTGPLDEAAQDEVLDVLVEAWKRRRFPSWRVAERDENSAPTSAPITLSPTFFSLADLEADPFEPSYRARLADRERWERTLAARTAEADAVLDTLLEVTRRAERVVLPGLVERRLDAADEPALEAQLLIDLRPGAGTSTTRVDHAIGVLQRLLGDAQSGDLDPSLPQPAHLGAVEQDWAWLGTYDTWRAAMSVFLYPENAATPAARSNPSEAFTDLAAVAGARSGSIDQALTAYSAYADAVGSLAPVASCLAVERVPGPAGPRPVRRTFAFAQADGVLYWSAVDDRVGEVAPGHPWAPVPGAPENAVVLGAAPAELSEDQRYVVLLVAEPSAGLETAVQVFRFDLETGHWWTDAEGAHAAPAELTPDAVGAVRGCILQRPADLVDGVEGPRTRPIRLAWRGSRPGKNREIQVSELDLEALEFRRLDDASVRLGLDITSVDAGWELAAPETIDPQDLRAPQFVIACRTAGADGPEACLAAIDPHLRQQEILDDGAHTATEPLTALAANRSVALHGTYGSPYVTAFTWSASEAEDGTVTEGTHAQVFHVAIEAFTVDGPVQYRVALTPYESEATPMSHTVSGISLDGPSLAIDHTLEVENTSGHHTAYAVSLPGGSGTARIRRSRLVQTVASDPGTGEDVVATVVATVGSLAPRLSAVSPPATREERETLQQRLSGLLATATGVDRFYIDEAFFGVPMLMMEALRRRHRADEAAAWARALYDDEAPEGERVVYAPLAGAVEPVPPTVQLPDLDAFDPLDPTAVFSVRRSAQLRYVLTTMARALLADADASFALDTPESVSAARRTYARVARLMAHPVLAEPAPTEATAGGTTVGARALAMAQARTRARLALHALPSVQLRLRDAAAAVAPAARTERASDLGMASSSAAGPPTRLLGLSEGFAVPPNPVVRGLRSRADNGLRKIRLGLNAAGLERPLVVRDTDLVVTSARGAAVRYQPTPYRATFLIDRARQLAGQAQQAEAALLQALEQYDTAQFSELQAQQQIEVAAAGVRLQDVRLNEAATGVQLAGQQLSRATFQAGHFQGLIDIGELADEKQSLAAMGSSYDQMMEAQELMTRTNPGILATAASVFGGVVGGASSAKSLAFLGPHAAAIGGIVGGLGSLLSSGRASNSTLAQEASSRAQAASTQASLLQQQASYERREQEWEFQRDLAGQDIQAARLGIRAAQSRVLVVEQERLIAALHVQHAAETARFLATQFTNAELYAWMSGVLEEVYTFTVRLATSTARLALAQLAFERQAPAPELIAGDYLIAEGGADRRGLTGSARLLADITRVEQHALDTDRRALQLVKTVSLSQLDPAAFEGFRRTGRLPFAFGPELFDRDHPGHYLRLVRSVSVSVVALVPPTQGIRATLLSGGLSPVVVEDGGAFRSVLVRRDPERVALSSPYAATGVFELGADGAQRYLPFEGGGVSGGWQLEMPKAANAFDYGSIADVLVTVQYTAHHSDAYRAEVIDRLGRTLDAVRPLSFRDDFADAWYDALNGDRLPVGEPDREPVVPGRPLPTRSWATNGIQADAARSAWSDVVVEVPVERTDFPPNLTDLELLHAAVYAVRPDSVEAAFDVTVELFSAEDLAAEDDLDVTPDAVATLSGTLSDGLLSSRSPDATATGWNGAHGPVGVWRFTFDGAAQAALADDVDDLLLVLSYRAETPAWLA